jgi:hypothetical protein
MAYDPFWIFQSPLSGDVNQRINAPWFSPALTVNIAGNAEIEERVVSEVASYGKQLGWLNEIVLALANDQKPPAKTLARMKEAVKAIEAIKEGKEVTSLQAAIDALDRLKKDQPEQYQELLRARLR